MGCVADSECGSMSWCASVSRQNDSLGTSSAVARSFRGLQRSSRLRRRLQGTATRHARSTQARSSQKTLRTFRSRMNECLSSCFTHTMVGSDHFKSGDQRLGRRKFQLRYSIPHFVSQVFEAPPPPARRGLRGSRTNQIHSHHASAARQKTNVRTHQSLPAPVPPSNFISLLIPAAARRSLAPRYDYRTRAPTSGLCMSGLDQDPAQFCRCR